jgi:hypothetical protein
MSRCRACWAILLILIVPLLGSNACTKRIAVDGAQFEATQNVRLSLTNGRSLQGRIGPGQRVEYRDRDAVYRARVAKVTADTIRLEGVLLLDRGDYEVVSRRLADARMGAARSDEAVVIPRTQVEKVELVKFDASRTARGLTFWTYGSALFLKFLGDRS